MGLHSCGYCFDVIACAAANRLSIFPVLVGDSEPPPCIIRLPFFDVRGCGPSNPQQRQWDLQSTAWRVAMQAHLQSAVFTSGAQDWSVLHKLPSSCRPKKMSTL